MEERKIRCFMDGIDFDLELGENIHGNTLYPSIEDVKEFKMNKNEEWLEAAGIVEVEVKLIRVAVPGKKINL